MTTVVSFIIVLGILIFIHELGHFLVAKYSGVGVERFSLGFGPRLFGIKVGETDYCISLIPFGGYVKMVGEAPDEEVSSQLKPKSFTHKPLRVRTSIVASGPLMNIALALILFPVLFMMGIKVPSYVDGPPVVGYVEEGEPAERAGLRPGDLIVAVDHKPISTWEELTKSIALSPEKSVTLLVRRNGREFTASITPTTSREGIGVAGLYPPMRPVIGGVTPGFPAERAGLRPGDLIVAIDGKPVFHWVELQKTIKKSPEERTLLIERDGRRFSVKLKPRYNEELQIYLIGVTRLEEFVTKSYGFFESIRMGLVKAWELTVLLFVIIKGLVTGVYSIKTLGGPIMIAQVAGRAAESGLADLISIIAFLSLQLGIINLLPIPVLDGGYLLFFAIEWIRGRPLSEHFLSIANQIGMALLLALMVFVTWNDLVRIFTN